jgi:uncharacterized protein
MSTTTEQLTVSQPKQGWKLPALVIGLAVLWWLAWGQLQNFADWLTYTVIGLSPLSHLGQSVNFFFYDVPKILMLLAGMIFLITIARSFFSAGAGAGGAGRQA